ncbi:MAG: hypothetical protein IJX99_06410 [Clostridia bacterium]|nr:hypothetical protein [Clostridia bacterium]
MYYINERDIEVEIQNEESIYIDNNSKFYEYVRRLVLPEQKMRVIHDKIQDNMGNYTVEDYNDLINSIQSIIDRIMQLMERRALTSKRVGENAEISKAIEEGDRDESFEDFRLQDEILENAINNLDKYSTDPNPVVTFAIIENTERVVSNLEGSITNFEKEIGLILPRPEKTVDEISSQILKRHQVNPESFAYAPISRGIERDVLLGEAINTAAFHFERQPVAKDIYNGLQRISNRSRRISQSRYEHYDMYRGTGETNPEVLIGANGENFYNRISPLDQKTIEGCGQIIRYSIDGNAPAVKSVTEQLDSDLSRISNFEEALVDVSRTHEKARDRHSRSRKYVPKIKQNSVRRLLDKINKKALGIGVAVALGTSLVITGINMATTLNDITKESEITNVRGGYTEITELPTTIQISDSYEIPGDDNVIVPTVTEQPDLEPEVDTQVKTDIEPVLEPDDEPEIEEKKVTTFPPPLRKGPLESLVENMSDEEVSKYATAFREGNDNIKYFRDAYVIANWGRYENDREFLTEAFKECDTRIDMVDYYGDSHQLAYQMIELMDTLIKSEIAEALEEKGMDVEENKINLYVTFNSGDKVNGYDIRYGEGQDEDMIVLARSVHMKGTMLDTAIRSRYELERAAAIVATFDPNAIMANATQNCYRIFEAYMSGKVDLIKRGELSDIRIENSKGFREVEGDSLEYDEDDR